MRLTNRNPMQRLPRHESNLAQNWIPAATNENPHEARGMTDLK
jgi:hypothetical protein